MKTYNAPSTKDWTEPTNDQPPSFIEDLPTFIQLNGGDNYILPDINQTNDKSVDVQIELGSGGYCMMAN